MKRWMVLVWLTGWLLHAENLPAETIPQPLAQQVRRLAQAMAFLGVPFHSDLSKNMEEALQEELHGHSGSTIGNTDPFPCDH